MNNQKVWLALGVGVIAGWLLAKRAQRMLPGGAAPTNQALLMAALTNPALK